MGETAMVYRPRMVRALVVSMHDTLPLEVVRCLGAAGIEVRLLGSRGRLASLSRYCRGYRRCPASIFRPPYAGALELVEEECRRGRIEVVVPSEIESSLMLASIAPRFRGAALFPVADAELVQSLSDKWQFAQLSARAGVPHPPTRLIERPEQFGELDLSRPVLTKPLRGAFGEGIVLLDSAAALERYLAGGGRDRLPILVQDLIPGRDVCMSVLADRGRIAAYTIQEPGADEATRNFLDDPRVREIGERLIAASGYHGVVHFDMRRDERDGSVLTLEANPRFWASLLYSLWAGVNFAELGVRQALGAPTATPAVAAPGTYRKPSLRPAAMIRFKLRGDSAPGEMAAPDAGAFRLMYGDPWPQLYNRLRIVARRYRRAAGRA
jgi:predicted ATP-grasp superfamily ATP-dependent carboligase